ncbi:MAG: hypothetical protein ABIH37_00185 [archaeon]
MARKSRRESSGRAASHYVPRAPKTNMATGTGGTRSEAYRASFLVLEEVDAEQNANKDLTEQALIAKSEKIPKDVHYRTGRERFRQRYGY